MPRPKKVVKESKVNKKGTAPKRKMSKKLKNTFLRAGETYSFYLPDEVLIASVLDVNDREIMVGHTENDTTITLILPRDKVQAMRLTQN